MFKKIFKINIVLLLALFTMFFIRIDKTQAASSKIYYITVSVGETYETAGINYHCDLAESSVTYSKNSTLSSGKTVNSVSTNWSVAQNPDDEATGFSARYVCKATLTELEPDTKYYYQITAGSEKSDILSFTTPSIDGGSSILFLTDTQSSDYNTFVKVNNLVKAIESKERNLNSVVMTGDIVDRGGYASQWEAFFGGLTSLQKYQQATIPGNHEYYHDDDPGYVDASFYNQFYNNPQNGPTDRVNSSYYFIYNDILFIMLDTIKQGYDTSAHIAWFKKVVEDNPSRWIIVGSHPGCISTGVYASDARLMRNVWQEVFEECQVDLAISGHEHIYVRKELSYQGEKNEALGVTYLIGPAAGPKDYAANNTSEFDEVKRGNFRGQVIKTKGSVMSITLYDSTGTVITSFNLNAKRYGEPMEITDKEILDSVSYEYMESSSTLKINWSSDIWGVVKKVSCSGDDNWTQTIPSNNEAFATHNLYAVYNDRNYRYTISFEKMDGTIISKDLTVILNTSLVPNQITINAPVKSTNVNETITLSATVLPSGVSQDVVWSSADDSIATVDSNGVVKGISAGRVYIYATSTFSDKVKAMVRITVNATSNPETFKITGLPIFINKDDSFTLVAAVTPADASKVARWTSSDEHVAYVGEYTGEVVVVGPGTVTISATSAINQTLSDSITFSVPETVISSVSISIPYAPKLNTPYQLGLLPTTFQVTDFTWSSDNESVGQVTDSGVFTALKYGTVVITATLKANNDIKATTTIKVGTSPTSISIGNIPSSIKVGDTFSISVDATPNNATNAYTYTSSDESVATIDTSGKVTILKEGTTIIKVISQVDDTIKAETTLTIASSKKGCGCKKSMEYIFTLALTSSLLFIILKKKH